MKLILKLLITIMISFLLVGCAVFTKTITVEKPVYIDRPLPIMKRYDVDSTFKFTGVINDGNYIKVEKNQLKKYISIKIELEKQLKKSNDQVDFYNKMVYESNKEQGKQNDRRKHNIR